jgi:hypothetical protein
MDMRHLINGCRVNLRDLNPAEIADLIVSTEARLERVNEELDSLKGEQLRRNSNVIPLFGVDDTQPFAPIVA